MEFVLENQYLKVTVTTWGAQVKSVVRKFDGAEHIWQADKSVWGYHAPILFPYAGRLAEHKMMAKGKLYEKMPQHGFARLMEHRFVRQTPKEVVLELTDSEETLALWPYRFRLTSTFTLENDTLHHKLTVENLDDEKMPFGIGFHPAFAIPFDSKHHFTDYVLRFDKVESPICMATPTGLTSGETYRLGMNITEIPIDDQLFANDSHCMTGLQSGKLGLYEKDTGRGVVCDISSFPYCLLWSTVGQPHFVCIEPWNSLPSPDNGNIDWEKKPAAAILAPGENWSTTLATSFVR